MENITKDNLKNPAIEELQEKLDKLGILYIKIDDRIVYSSPKINSTGERGACNE